METDLVEQYTSFEFARTNWHSKILKCGSVLFITQFICHLFAQLKRTPLCETTVIPPYLTVDWPWFLSRSIPMKWQIIVLGQCPHLCKQSKNKSNQRFSKASLKKNRVKTEHFNLKKNRAKQNFYVQPRKPYTNPYKKSSGCSIKLLFQI